MENIDVFVEVRYYTQRIGIQSYPSHDWVNANGETMTTVVIDGKHVDINDLV